MLEHNIGVEGALVVVEFYEALVTACNVFHRLNTDTRAVLFGGKVFVAVFAYCSRKTVGADDVDVAVFFNVNLEVYEAVFIFGSFGGMDCVFEDIAHHRAKVDVLDIKLFGDADNPVAGDFFRGCLFIIVGDKCIERAVAGEKPWRFGTYGG